ncbi:right-handed parallel beta-helix repeat-containing protein [Demequina sp. TTPB684]|uniref:right-handed parallel beta-helix repeat-containing protein n=1 Tax=unclassified Demequina TaxID=2620311 RepID=UPI001CF5CA9C|nr:MULTISPECIES: right-handed parallel beta-helix repeat-containing protein [unclassified Demequina]MCB2413289.1 right-handed parallel beta-helix repeat-containing protein [Demequina sp. TTPB684]UPU88991.1 right-handed parallel beta-helix repeat-containing protein [Demequina sp. TMPB413]
MNTSSIVRRSLTVAVAAVVAATSLGASAASAGPVTEVGSPIEESAAPTQSAAVNPVLESYGGDPAREAELVAAEDRRLIDVDLVANGTLFPQLNTALPFRVAGKPVTTLVLPGRDAAYTERDLEVLAPLSFVETSPGVYELSEHIVILDGATLDLRRPGGLLINMTSQENGFASIVVAGGNLVIEGTPTEHVEFQAWDSTRRQPDTETADGRAYIRVMGGYASITNASFSDMGFWSGVTGGLALTGTQLASTLGLDSDGQREIPEVHLAAPDTAETVEEGDPLIVDGTSEGETGVDLSRGAGLYSQGVTAWMSGLTVNGNAFGLFVSDATSVELQNSDFMNNLVDGVVFHREVINSRVTGVESSGNGGDGFRVTRGSQGVLLDTVEAVNNGGNGITIDATPLAGGPSATGLPVNSYGGHSILNSRFTNNGKYGIAVIGGADIAVRRNTVEGGEFGIMATDVATNIAIEENRVESALKQGIVFRDGVNGQIWGNIVNGGEIGIYVRDSTAAVARNTIDEVTSHGVTMVGAVNGSLIGQNEVGGQGNSPIDTVRASGVSVLDNNESPTWIYQNITERVIRMVTKPMTLLWTILAMLLLLTAFRGFRYRGSGFGNPYRDRTPLHDLSQGLVDPATVPGVVRPLEVELQDARDLAHLPSPSGLPRRITDREQVRT